MLVEELESALKQVESNQKKLIIEQMNQNR